MTTEQPQARLIEACEGVYRLKIPLSIQKGTVNSYFLPDGRGGWVIIDPGYNTDACRAGWLEAMETLHFGFEDISLILVTHFHSDHAGLAGWFQKRCAAPIYMHPLDVESYNAEWDGEGRHVDKMVAFMSQYGLRPERVGELREQMARVDVRSIDRCTHFEPLRVGDVFPVEGGTLRTVYAPGHSEGQCMFYFPERKLLFSADMLLPLTYAPVGLRSYGSRDPIAAIIAALDRLSEAFSDPEINCLPGHGWLLDETGTRFAAAGDHFRETAQWYFERCRRESATAYAIAEEIASGGTKRKFHLIMSEAMAYLEYLHGQGRLARETDETGVFRFSAV